MIIVFNLKHLDTNVIKAEISSKYFRSSSPYIKFMIAHFTLLFWKWNLVA